MSCDNDDHKIKRCRDCQRLLVEKVSSKSGKPRGSGRCSVYSTFDDKDNSCHRVWHWQNRYCYFSDPACKYYKERTAILALNEGGKSQDMEAYIAGNVL